jgi:hypothetical protein
MLLFASSSASAIVSWQITEDSVSLGLSGVSPFVERLSTGIDRVWRSGGLNGSEVSDCTDAGVCTTVTLGTRFGSDVSILSLADGSRRAYFVEIVQGTSNKQVYSAPCSTAECLSIGTKVATSSEMVGPQNAAWGVPDPVLLPDGRVRIYIVESPVDGSCLEKIASYISDSSGVTFTKESGWRLEGGFVDTEVLRAKTGDWLMITSNGPGCGTQQRLFITTSTDGLTWSTPIALTDTSKSRLDPTGFEISTDVFRIYFAASASTKCGGDCVYTIARATLKIGSNSAVGSSINGSTTNVKVGQACTKSGAKATSGKTKLICKKLKGKLVWSK